VETKPSTTPSGTIPRPSTMAWQRCRKATSLVPRLLEIAKGNESKQAWSQATAVAFQARKKHAFADRTNESSLLPRNVREITTSEVVTGTSTTTAVEQTVKNPTPEISYDESNHERFTPGDPSKRAFTYFVLTGGRFIYASVIRLAVLKFVLSMTAAKDVLALASLEVDLSAIEKGQTITVKWRGKPVFIKHRTENEVTSAQSVDTSSLRDPEPDNVRAQNPEWLVVVGVCTHLGCVPISNAGDYHGWFCPCHGSHYDVSGRIRKGPAPLNLEVPEYKFLEEEKVVIG